MKQRLLIILPVAAAALGFMAWGLHERSRRIQLEKRLTNGVPRKIENHAGQPVTTPSTLDLAPAAEHRPPPGQRNESGSGSRPKREEGQEESATPPTPEKIMEMIRSGDRGEQTRALENIDLITDLSDKLEALSIILKSHRDDDRSRGLKGRAMEKLKELGGPDAVAIAIDVMNTAHFGWERRSAVNALGDMGDQTALSALQAAYDESGIGRKAAVAVALRKLGDATYVSRFAQDARVTYGNVNGALRENVMKSLGRLKDPAIVIPLASMALSDANHDVRHTAVKALGETGSPDAIPYLKTALDDPKKDIRRSAARAIERIENP